jgi:hypothetical protein
MFTATASEGGSGSAWINLGQVYNRMYIIRNIEDAISQTAAYS